ncbi:hypothetical protein Agub_g5400, partial [Astrephomene gubernaculifera]
MPLNPYAPEWKPPALRGPPSAGAKAGDDEEFVEAFDLAGLPEQVISLIIACLTSPVDLTRCACACKLLQRHVCEAELCLDIRGVKTLAGHTNMGNSEEKAGHRSKALVGLRKYMRGTVALLLPNASLEDADVEELLTTLPQLQLLDVSGGRKLTHASASAIAQSNTSVAAQACASTCFPETAESSATLAAVHDEGSQHPPLSEAAPVPATAVSLDSTLARRRSLPLRFINMQRCFQLHSGSLGKLLGTPGLRCLALSHLDLGHWPNPAAMQCALAAEPTHRSSGLQVLALHNCLRLNGPAITALASLVGGLPESSSINNSNSTVPYRVPQAAASGVRFLMLGGSTLALASFLDNNSSSSPSDVTQPPLPPHLEELLVSSYKPASTSTAATVQAHLAAVRHLVAAALAMPQLLALELTFFPPPLVACVRRVLADAAAMDRTPVVVWDFSGEARDVQAARRALERTLRVARRACEEVMDEGETGMGGVGSRGGGNRSGGSGGMLDEFAVAAIMRCAVNCSNVTRSTPLHTASERGDAGGVRHLLDAGAAVDARDTAGSTPLFLASEAGHMEVVTRLLAAGADLRQSNAAGETPLYIASLRGHLGCVKELLTHCKKHGIAWQEAELYGDAWTPLHAAAVANRADVAACLLQAAGTSRAPQLVVAPNKYG